MNIKLDVKEGEIMEFPKGFLWGTSISAAQCEGGWNEGGRAPVQVDFANAGSALTSGR